MWLQHGKSPANFQLFRHIQSPDLRHNERITNHSLILPKKSGKSNTDTKISGRRKNVF